MKNRVASLSPFNGRAFQLFQPQVISFPFNLHTHIHTYKQPQDKPFTLHNIIEERVAKDVINHPSVNILTI